MLLGLTRDEIVSIRIDNQLAEGHLRYLHLEALTNNPQTDNNDNRYFAFRVRLQGFDNDQRADIITPQHEGNDIIVFSRDNQFFSSYLFSAEEAITDGENRIEFHIYHDGVIKITDNIDMALIHDVQNVHYRWRANDTAAFTDICESNIVMADRMKRRPGNSGVIANMNNAPHNFPEDPFVQYQTPAVHPKVDAEESFKNGDRDIATTPREARPNNTPPVTASTFGIRKYNNQNKTVFLIHYVTADVNNATLGIDLNFENTLRHYTRPDLAAALIGALIDINHTITCQGFAYEDASCYPSAEHVNGEAADTNYGNTQENIEFIQAMLKYGFGLFRIGNSSHETSNNIYNNTAFTNNRTAIFRRDGAGSTLHQTHLHSTNVSLNDGQKTP